MALTSDSADRVKVEKKSRGRPKAFKTTEAVKKAMVLFWERGYEGTSYEALTSTLGISPSSFQNAFGNKEALYRLAVDFYMKETTAWFAQELGGPGSTHEVFRRLVDRSAQAFIGGELPAGCMVSVSATQISPSNQPIRVFGAAIRRLSEEALEERIRKGIADGDVPKEVDSRELAAYIGTMFRGMAIQARDGAALSTLLQIGRRAMLGWPSESAPAVSPQRR